MKKAITLVLLMAAGYGSANAQAIPDRQAMKDKLRQLVAMNENATAAKTTATMQRLIGSAMINAMGQVTDTHTYTYSNDRGSAFDLDILDYMTAYSYSNYNNYKTVNYDTNYNKQNGEITVTSYTPGNAPAVQTQYTTSGDEYRDTWTYNAQNQVTEALTENFSGSMLTWGYHVYYVYDAAGKIINDSTEVNSSGSGWVLTYKTEYTYNSSNQLDMATSYSYSGGVWTPSNRYTITYTGMYPSSAVFEVYNGSSWDNTSKLDNVYSNGQKVAEKYYLWGVGTWDIWYDEYRHLNNKNLPDSVYERSFDGFTTWDTTITKLAYNSFDNPTGQQYYNAHMSPRGSERYTYETYDPAGVQEVAALQKLMVYPNPAGAQITIAAGDLKHGTAAYAITSVTGQQVMKGTGTVNAGKMNLDISGLKAGMYWLQLRDAAGTGYRATISKAE